MGIRISSPGSLVTLVEAGSFCVSDVSGDVLDSVAGGAGGLFVADRRVLSRLAVTVNGAPLTAVDHHVDDPAAATFVGRAVAGGPGVSPDPEAAGGHPARANGPIVVRRRTLGAGLRDEIEVRNVGAEPAYVEVEVDAASDLAPLVVARSGVRQPDVDPVEGGADDEVVLARGRGSARVGCRVTLAGGSRVRPDALRWEAIVPTRGRVSVTVTVSPIVGGAEMVPGALLDTDPAHRRSVRRLAQWQDGVPRVVTDHAALQAAVRRSASDLGALRVLDAEFPERAVPAAGSPWHRALHGRDALLASWMSLILDPGLALGTLETLARFQGTDDDPRTEEQPGRIPHRLRFGTPGFGPVAGSGAGDGSDRARSAPAVGLVRVVDYGSVDATPLFVMLLGEMRRWGLAPEVVERLLPHADRALDWIVHHGDRDGDGYVEYQRATDRGERHQCWKDSAAPIPLADGAPARGPIAPAEVQGYVYAAYQARAHFASEAGDEGLAAHWRERAADLRAAFNRDFWVDESDWLALALDGDKRPVPALASNVGHCLWSGIVDEEHAAVMAKHLVSDDLFSGWGVRTLATSMRAYDPLGPHTGAVWPHDTALCVAGLVRYGFVDEAHRLLLAQLESGAEHGGRLAVLCGFDRDDVAAAVRFPDGCTTRAWSAAAPLLHLRSLLRFDPHVPQGRLWLSPVLPDAVGSLRVERIPLLGGTVSVSVEGGRVAVDDLPAGIEVVAQPRRPISATP